MLAAGHADGPDQDLMSKVRHLARPQAYPAGTTCVEVRETHMSFIFLTDTEAWKLKKPICLPPLDFTTPTRRRRACTNELRLNRRLARDVYRSVHRLSLDTRRGFLIDEPGRTVDWLLRMRRLPEHRMLDVLIHQARVTPDEICLLASVLARFYDRQKAIFPPAASLVDSYAHRLADSRRTMERFLPLINRSLSLRLLQEAETFLSNQAGLLAERISRGHFVDGHGDLRAEHVCLEDVPRIIDCLEFDRSLRRVDPFEEAAFLGLDCARLGADWIAPLMAQQLGRQLGAPPCRELMNFFLRFHACNRARIALRHLCDAQPATPARWPAMSDAYIHAAQRLIEEVI